MSLSFSTLCERMRAHAVYMGEGLQFPRATEAEIQTCEERLGFKLPPMLREIYKTVANGGNFWLGYDIATTDDLVEQHNNFLRYRVSSRNQSRLFDDATVEALRAHPGAYACPEHLPDGFLRLVHTGCNVWANLEGSTGHLYLNDEVPEDATGYSFCADSLEEWLERWFAEPPSRSTEARYYAHYPLADVLAAESKDTQNGAKEQQLADSPSEKPTLHRSESSMDVFRKNLLTGLERSRMEIARQIHYVDAVHRAIAESDEADYFKRDWLSDLKLTVQELAEVEAQLDNLILTRG